MGPHPGWPSFFAVLFGSAITLAIMLFLIANFPR